MGEIVFVPRERKEYGCDFSKSKKLPKGVLPLAVSNVLVFAWLGPVLGSEILTFVRDVINGVVLLFLLRSLLSGIQVNREIYFTLKSRRSTIGNLRKLLFD